jgi:hypothetical protein
VTLGQVLFDFAGRLAGQFEADHLGQERRSQPETQLAVEF